ncbi:leucyl aminopeptidase family protein [Rhizomonospora bruguierae]|uniref:leucyl aminopeptidase family protein n=1 Tax=Rhizomonospora bruguierae TaxID=1581705 RepID=UPI001BCB37B4|nr:leucyl aminopeptidase family protein [Micromonospora sp. NBRC 107566]
MALPVAPGGAGPRLLPTGEPLPEGLAEEAAAFLADAEHTGEPGALADLPRPLRQPGRLLLVGVGAAETEAQWRAAGAAIARADVKAGAIRVPVPAGAPPAAVRGLAEGLLLGAYEFSLKSTEAAPRPEVTIAVDEPGRYLAALDQARAVAEATRFARDLTNFPSLEKDPAWFAGRVEAAASGTEQLRLTVRGPAELAAEGFGGILAVGGGSDRPPRLVELAWEPPDATRHVVLVGKGITFDTGGICVKPKESMVLMRKDMGGAASVVAAVLGAAALRLPVRVTALAPLAENMLGADAMRPGDVIHHYGGMTSESTNTDAEGRLVLADALAYAVARLAPDLLVDLATLTGANAVALGKRTAALYSESDDLAAALRAAADQAGERVWRLPLPADYVEHLGSDIADLHSSPTQGAGSVVAALYLREFTGDRRDRWAHLDMSAPSWIEANEGELTKGATGWGVRTLLRWLEGLVEEVPPAVPPAREPAAAAA